MFQTEVFDDFAPKGSGELGLNEIIPLVSQACLGPRPSCRHQEDTENTETPEVFTEHITIETGHSWWHHSRTQHLRGVTSHWDTHRTATYNVDRAPVTARTATCQRCWESSPSCPLSHLWVALDLHQLPQHSTGPAACIRLS